MKTEVSIQPKSNLLKKTVKPLNEKKNSSSIQNTLQKQKSRTNLTLIDNSETTNFKGQKLVSPKTTTMQMSILSPKTQGNEQFFKSQKSDIKKNVNNNKIKKVGLLKHEPIKKQTIQSMMKSPKNSKNNILSVQSEIFLNSQSDRINEYNEESNLNIDLDTSIAAKISSLLDQDKQKLQMNQNIDQCISKKQSQVQNQKQIFELRKTSNQQLSQIQKLKQKNEELQRKLQKLKTSHDQNKKKLRERISTFNGQGEETMFLKQKINQLQKKVECLEKENQLLKNIQNKITNEFKHVECSNEISQINETLNNQMKKFNVQLYNIYSFSIFPQIIQLNKQISKTQMIDQCLMTSFDDEICDSAISFINGNYSNRSQYSVLSNEKLKQYSNQSQNNTMIPSFQIQLIKCSYEQKYKQKMDLMQNKFDQGINDIEKRFKLLLQQVNCTILSQQKQIAQLQNKIDDLYQKIQECECQQFKSNNRVALSIQTKEQDLKHIIQINRYNKKNMVLEQKVKEVKQQLHIKDIECKKYMSELDIERIKYNINSQINWMGKDLLHTAVDQKSQLLREQLKIEKQRNVKLSSQNEKKEELIKKLMVTYNNNKKNYHSSNPNSNGISLNVNKKLKK